MSEKVLHYAKRPLTPEERAIPYAKYYDLPVEGRRPSDAQWLDQPMAPSRVLPALRAKEFLRLEGEIPDSVGWCILEDGTTYIACKEHLPGITPQMMGWWFGWFWRKPDSVPEGVGNLRYKIWCPPDHWDLGPMPEGHPAAGRHFLDESLDMGVGEVKVFTIQAEPKDCDLGIIGLSAEEQQALTEHGCVVTFGPGYDKDLRPGGIGINFFRPTPDGCDWYSRGWGGYTVRDGQIVKIPNFQHATAFALQTELAHNLAERRHLPDFLPELYAEYKDKPIEMDW